MTSLPQNIPTRAPRGAGQLAMPPLASSAYNPAAAGSLSGADVWRIIRANLWLIAGTLLVAAVAGYLLNMWLLATHARYTASALLSVRDTQSSSMKLYDAGGGVNPQGLEIEQRTQAKQLTNEGLLSDLLSESNTIRATDWFKQFITYKNGQQVVDAQAAKQDLMEHLDVSPIPTSRLLEVRMSYSVPKDCKTIVQELCEQHIKNARIRQTQEQNDRIKSLSDLKERYEAQQQNLRTYLEGLARSLGENGVFTNGANSKQLELMEVVQQRDEMYKVQVENEQKLASFQAMASAGLSPEMMQAMKNDPLVANYTSILGSLEVSSAQLELLYGPENKTVQATRKQAETYRKLLTDAQETSKDLTQQIMEKGYRTMAASAKQAREQFQARYTQLMKEIADLSTKTMEYERKMGDLRQLNAKLDLVTDEQEKLQAVLSSPRFSPVELAQAPNLPDHPTFPRLSIVMGLAMLLGAGLSVGIAFLRELTDTSVRSPRDIARVGQMTLLGMIPHESDDPQVSGGRLPLAIYESPHSMIAEQFRQVRTRLQHAASLDTTRSILVTGCSPQDGKTTVASNIAAGLALNGRRILLVDANFRRPNLHAVFTVGNESGFGDVLNSPELFAECVRPTEVPNLSVMPCGARPSNPTELLESQLLVDFIERALEEYDHVIFDSGPLLMVSDSIALAPRVDGVITVVRARGNSRGLLQRVRDELRRLKAEHLGVVLNAVRVQGGGYYGPMIKNHYAYQTR